MDIFKKIEKSKGNFDKLKKLYDTIEIISQPKDTQLLSYI